MNYIIDSYFGFGDNIYHIPFVHKLAQSGEVFIYTPWPEIFRGMKNVSCFRAITSLKAQAQNMSGNSLFSRDHHPDGQRIRFNYGNNFKSGMTVMQSFERTVPLDGDWFFEMPVKPSEEADLVASRARRAGKKLCVMRLPSIRSEWACYSRAPLMKHFQKCIDRLKDEYYIVTVGDIGNREEYTEPEPVGVDEKRDDARKNHLRIWDMVALVYMSDLVVSMQCNILPICQILKKKSFFIYGGYVPHRLLNDERFYQVGYVEPDPFCACVKNEHRCANKEIDHQRLIAGLEAVIAQN